jgi:hypothetical protein
MRGSFSAEFTLRFCDARRRHPSPRRVPFLLIDRKERAMAVIAGIFTWVRVNGGVWTRIGQGPLASAIPFQGLEIYAIGNNATVSWTFDTYSAAPPFYNRTAGVNTVPFFNSLPIGYASYVAILSNSPSPWVEFWILTSQACFVHVAYL